VLDRPVAPRPSMAWRVSVFVLLSLLVLSPLNTKVAGVLWFFTLLIALGLALSHRSGPVSTSPVVRAARIWLLYMLGATLLWWTSAWIWNDPWARGSADLHSAARLLSAALAGWAIVRLAPGRVALPSSGSLIVAISLACLSAYVLSLLITREHYPSNAVPWAAAIACLVCVLFPVGISKEICPRVRGLALLGSALGILALFENQTRGAYGVVIWLLALWILSNKYRGSRLRGCIATAALALTVVGSIVLPSNDPLRLREAWHDVRAVISDYRFDTSVGARLYLYKLAAESIAASPMIGIGSTDRLALIKGTLNSRNGNNNANMHNITELGHVHNAYLHHLLDGGLIALLGFFLTIGGIVHAGGVLKSTFPVASRQLWSIAFVHASTNLSNVNLAHNYYALMLSISLLLVFLSAYRDQVQAPALLRA
jgi:O-antigen ligase